MKLNKTDEVWNITNLLFQWIFGLLSAKNFATMATRRKDFSLAICYRAFSITWTTSMKNNLQEKENAFIRKEFNSHRIGLGHQHARRFIVLKHQYSCRDVKWKTLYNHYFQKLKTVLVFLENWFQLNPFGVALHSYLFSNATWLQ